MNRSSQLDTLIDSLGALVAILSLDPRCQWRKHFDECLLNANCFKTSGFTQSQLNELSGLVRSVFGGMGSFNDYAPLLANPNGSFGFILGMEHLEQSAGAVYANALALMVAEGEAHAL